MSLEIVVDNDRAKWVISTLLDAWQRKLPPFDRIQPVPARLPNNLAPGSIEHACFLFVSCYFMRGKINSATALVQLSYLYEREPWLFDPRRFVEIGLLGEQSLEESVQEHLKEAGLGFNYRETSRFWVANFVKLARFWEGNPLLIFKKSRSYQSLCRILMQGKGQPDSPTGFLCFRHKMASMLTYFYSRARLINPFDHPGPVDFHNLRIGLATEIFVSDDTRENRAFSFEKLSSIMRQIYMEHCRTPEDALDLADALWHQSRTFCMLSQGNSSSVSKEYRARSTEITPRSVKWLPSDVDRYNRSCGLCCIESVCKWSIPSANNYNEGVVRVRGERPVPHRYQLPILDVPRVLKPRPAHLVNSESVEGLTLKKDGSQISLF